MNDAISKHKRTFPIDERFRFWLFGGSRTGLNIPNEHGYLFAYNEQPLWMRIYYKHLEFLERKRRTKIGSYSADSEAS